MKKLLYILLLLVCLTGCSTQYNLEISNEGIKETIVSTILDSEIPVQTKEEINAHIELDDPITPFINGEHYPFSNNQEKKYNKDVKKENNSTIVTLKYDYKFDEYKNSRAFKECFENKTFDYDKNGYLLQMTGKFYCLYGDKIEINIKTNNKVNSHNADKVSGNTYTWIINKDNMNKADIKINISKESAYQMHIIMIILDIFGVIIIVVGYTAYKKIKNRDEINKI